MEHIADDGPARFAFFGIQTENPMVVKPPVFLSGSLQSNPAAEKLRQFAVLVYDRLGQRHPGGIGFGNHHIEIRVDQGPGRSGFGTHDDAVQISNEIAEIVSR